MDIELVCSSPNSVGIMLDNVIIQEKPPRTTLTPLMNLFHPAPRLANLLHVPELSLVVAGSICGRVVLITLTCLMTKHYSFKHGFKVEAILPTRNDEDRHLRPICPLLGVAIGPIPSSGYLPGERRYRICRHFFLHYYWFHY